MPATPSSRPSALACGECRRKHLKCDALSPVCSRCSRRGLVCAYTASRRGHRPNTTRRHSSASEQQDEGAFASARQNDSAVPSVLSPRATGTNPTPASGSRMPATGLLTPELLDPLRSGTSALQPLLDITQRLGPPRTPDATVPNHSSHEQYLTNLYFSRFHQTHPMLVPQYRYVGQKYPPYVRLAVQLVGSHFSTSGSSSDLRMQTESAIAACQERSVFLCQSLLLFAIALHSHDERAKAFAYLAKATDLAIELGLNRSGFATAHGMQDPVVEESLRRTWWELYVVDGYFAALHRQNSFKCNTVELTAYLPSDDLYDSGFGSTQSKSLDHFDQRIFTDQEAQFSSASYRIDAIRLLGRVISISKATNDVTDAVQAVDRAIAVWRLYLPESKTAMVDHLGEVDQMMMQAHAFIEYASIILHFPRSELSSAGPNVKDIPCAEHMIHASPALAHHAMKAISASKAMSHLASLPITDLSPLFICNLVFGCIVQLSACTSHAYDGLMQHRDRVAVMTGVLRRMSRNWAVAGNVLKPLNAIANGTFNPSADTGSIYSQLSLDSGIDVDAMPQDMSWLDLFYAGDMNAEEWNFPCNTDTAMVQG